MTIEKIILSFQVHTHLPQFRHFATGDDPLQPSQRQGCWVQEAEPKFAAGLSFASHRRGPY